MNERRRRRLRRSLTACGAAVLLVSLAANAVLYRYAMRYFYEAQELRLDPAGRWTYGAERAAAKSSSLRVVLFGDSRAQMWDPASMPRHLDIINRGIGSQTSHQVLERVESDLLSLQADIVVIQVGVNDLKDIPLFPERREWIVSQCKRNIAAIVARASSGGARVLLTTIFPSGPVELARRPFWSSDIDESIVEVNDYIRSLHGARCSVVDAYSVLAHERNVAEKYESDALHINAAGYEALNETIGPLLTSPQ